MAGFGNLISNGAGLVSGIANIFKQKKVYKKRKQELDKREQELDKREQENENWYNQRYNEDATQRADAQAMITKTQDAIRERNADAKGTAAVMGGTEESVAATKAANAQALADTASSIVQNADARKDRIENQYLAQRDSLEEKRDQLAEKRDQLMSGQQQAMTDAISNMGEVFS